MPGDLPVAGCGKPPQSFADQVLPGPFCSVMGRPLRATWQSLAPPSRLRVDGTGRLTTPGRPTPRARESEPRVGRAAAHPPRPGGAAPLPGRMEPDLPARPPSISALRPRGVAESARQRIRMENLIPRVRRITGFPFSQANEDAAAPRLPGGCSPCLTTSATGQSLTLCAPPPRAWRLADSLIRRR